MSMRRIGVFTIMLCAVLATGVYNSRVEQQRYEPRIREIAAGKELVVSITGAPRITRDTAAKALYSAGRILKLSPSYMSGRHAHWQQRDNISPENWEVHYARPVPETTVDLGDIRGSDDVTIGLHRREKSIVAEIRHLGRYEDIPIALAKLRRFILTEGYRLDGYYEEVYLVFESIEPDPGRYETLLRYQVSVADGTS